MRDQTDATTAPWEHRWAGRPHARWMRGPYRGGPLQQQAEGRLAAGVAAGLAARLGLDATLVRTAFVVATIFSGFGAAAYVVGWLLIPEDGADGNIATRALADRRGIALAAALGSLLAVLLILGSALGARWLGTVAWPLVVSVVGLVLLWRNAPEREQALLHRLTDPLLGLAGGGSRTRIVLRVVVAALLIGAGMGLLFSGHAEHYALRGLGRGGAAAGRGGDRARARGGCASPAIWWWSGRPGSGPRNGPTWRPGCTTRCCRRWP